MQKWRIGDVTITKVVESVMIGMEGLFPEATRAALLADTWLRPHFLSDEGDLKLSFHALVIETPDRKIIVDTCVGNDKTRPGYPTWDGQSFSFLSDLADAGYPRDSIDTVLCTHLHVDHVGWNTMKLDGRWVPTFPNARYLMGRREFEHWRDEADQEGIDAHFRDLQAIVRADSIEPVFSAGLVDLVETDHRICDEVSLIPTLGHTPGHVSVKIASKGAVALITGDFVHHPCQMAHPNWSTFVDYDGARSKYTRDTIFSALAGTRILVIGTHFAGPTAGYVVRDGDAFRFRVDQE